MLIVNDADKAVINQTIGTEIATLPLSNVQKYSNSRVFRTMDIAQTQFTMKWIEPVIMSGVVLWRNNFSNSATWHIEIFSDEAMTTLLYDSLVLPAVEQKTLGEIDWLIDPLVASVVDMKLRACDHWFDDISVQAMRITLVDPDNEHGFIDIGRIYAGRALQPRFNFSYGHKSGWKSQTKQKRTSGGSGFAKKKARPRAFSFTLDWLNDSDRPHFYNAIQQTGDDTDWYISMFPGVGGQKERNYAMACMFDDLPEFTADFFNNYKAPFNVGEV